VENQPIKVLLVDDDQGDFEMFRSMLSKAEHHAYAIDWVSTYEEAMDAFDAGRHDVYFLDYHLEDRTGLDLLREARNRRIEAPIILLTGRGSRAVDMEAMELGASDYLVKGFIDPDALERAIRHALERMEGGRALRELEEAHGMGGGAADPFHGDTASFWALFDATRSGVALVDLQGMVTKVNPPFTALFAPTPRYTEGLAYLDLLDEADREAVGKEMKALVSGQRPRFEAARRFLTREGRAVWAHTTSVLIRDQAGEPHHVMIVTERVGEEKA